MKKNYFSLIILIILFFISCDNGVQTNPNTINNSASTDPRLYGTWYDSTYHSTVNLKNDGNFENINYLGDYGTWEDLGDIIRFEVSSTSTFNPSTTFNEKYRFQSDDVLIFLYEHPTDPSLNEDFIYNRIP